MNDRKICMKMNWNKLFFALLYCWLGLSVQAQNNAELQYLRHAKQLPIPEAKPSEIEAALNLIKKYELKRMEKGDISGVSLLSKEKMTLELARKLSTTTRALACAVWQKIPKAEENFALFFDYLIAEKAIECIPRFRYSNYSDVRRIPADFLSALTICNDTQKKELIKRVKGLVEFEQLYLTPLQLKANINSDYIYNVLPHLFICALYHPDETQATDDLRAFSHFLSTCTQYTPGGNDLFKPDGTGFHHKTHYNGYMYSYKTLVEYVGQLKGTTFRIDRDAYQRIKKAVISIYLMATRSQSDEHHYYANSLAGRHPFTGIGLSFTQPLFDLLIEVGGDIKGEIADLELASYYNYFFMTKKYREAPEIHPEGFYQFNYSPLGIYRHDNWVATMRCPTTNFWGAEIYAGTNRFGRYQSHGTLEILYDGSLSDSGYPDSKEDGWDWNMMPGSTTVHYTSWEEMMPGKNEKDRFDQKSLTTNFSGALSWGNCGMFAAAFNQGDNWGSPRFEPTNLSFCKSVFAFDGMLVSLGSYISAIGNYSEDRLTATHLFQAMGNKGKAALIVNGKEVKQGSLQQLEMKQQDIWMITSHTTGYYLPAGNDSLVVQYGEQEAPASTGFQEGMKKGIASKAYFKHGIKPKNKGYYFVTVPNTTPQKMERLAKRLQKDGDLLDVLSTQDSTHVLKHHPSGTLAYALFAPASDFHYGYLHSSNTEMLFMERMEQRTETLHIALCNPNLRPQPSKEFGWISTPTYTTFVLNGDWKLVEEQTSEKILSLRVDSSKTTIKVALTEGEPLYLRLFTKASP